MRNKQIKNRNRYATRVEYRYCGIFRIRLFLMKRMPHLYSKLFAKGLVKSRRAIKDALLMRKGESEYRYARYLISYLEIKQDRAKLIELMARWMRETNNEHLLRYFTDAFIFFNDVYIVTGRPGLWIGSKGNTIDSLRDFLRENMLPAVSDIQLCELPCIAEETDYEIQRQKDFQAKKWTEFFNMPEFADFMEYLDEYVDYEENPKPLWSELQKEGDFETLSSIGLNKLF